MRSLIKLSLASALLLFAACGPGKQGDTCSEDKDCGAGLRCEVIYCIQAPCPPASCQPK